MKLFVKQNKKKEKIIIRNILIIFMILFFLFYFTFVFKFDESPINPADGPEIMRNIAQRHKIILA